MPKWTNPTGRVFYLNGARAFHLSRTLQGEEKYTLNPVQLDGIAHQIGALLRLGVIQVPATIDERERMDRCAKRDDAYREYLRLEVLRLTGDAP